MRYLRPVCALVVLTVGCTAPPTQPTPSCTFSLSSTSAAVGAEGGTVSVAVATQSGCGWTAASGTAWVTIASGTAGTGPGTVVVAVEANPGGTPRSATLTVAGLTVSVSQAAQACTYVVTPEERTFGAAGGTGAFDVAAPPGCAWEATSADEWITVAVGVRSPEQRATAYSGHGTVGYVVAANSDERSRTGRITVAGVAHVIQQSGVVPCQVTIAPDDEDFGPAGGTGAFSVSAAPECAWAVQSTVGWIQVTSPPVGSGRGSGTVSYRVEAHTGLGSRTGTMTVGGQTFVVHQAGNQTCTYAVSPTSFAECLRGRERTFAVDTQSGCAWTASPSAAWLSVISGHSGTGSGSVRFAFSDNFLDTRDANVEVRWLAPTLGQNVRVVQTGCLYALAPAILDVAASGGDVAFEAYASPVDPACGGPLQDACMWTAVSQSSWVSVLTSMPRYGDNRVTCRVAPNASGAERTTTITVGTRTIVIRQGG